MSAYTIPCPLCNAPLRSARPIPPGRMVRCPQCGGHFNAVGGPEEAPAAAPPPAAPPVPVSPAFKTGLMAFGLVAVLALLLGGGIGLAVHANHEAERRAATAESERKAAEAERRAANEQLAAAQKLLEDQRKEFARERRERERAFERERQARAAEEKPPAPVVSAPPPAPTPPAPRPAEDPDVKKRADYEAHVDAGRAAMVAQRYADALREYQAALRLMPGDVIASRGVRDAEDRLDAQQEQNKRRTSVAALVDKAKDALRAKHYDDALSAANEALKQQPDDADAKQVQRDVTKARRSARAEFLQLMSAGDEARDAGRLEEASRLYARALQIFPDDATATRSKQAVDQVTQDATAGLTAYYRFMASGMLAMQTGQYLTAAQAFGEALRLVPTDLAAARGYRDATVAVNGVVAGQAKFYQQLQLGYAALQTQRPADAVTAFQAALRLVPDSPLAAAGLQQARAMKK